MALGGARRAERARQLRSLRLLSLRDFSPLRHAQVDDAPFGGGAGMLLRVDVMVAALEGAYGQPLDEVRAQRRIVALDPGGPAFDDAYARELAAAERVTLLCGRYEGFDGRILEHVATESLSLGPFVLSGGEPAAMAVIDAVFRLLPGALGDDSSSDEESFSPQLERPPRVPALHAAGGFPRLAAFPLSCSPVTMHASPSGAANRRARGARTTAALHSASMRPLPASPNPLLFL